MSPTIKKPTAWVLSIFLVIISGVGEGLHWIPGCGHATVIGNAFLLLGIEAPQTHGSADGRPRVGHPQGDRIPIYDEDQCAICAAVGQSCMLADSGAVPLVTLLIHGLPPVAICIPPEITIHPSQARAPPLA